MTKRKAKDIGLALIVVPVALPALLVLGYLRAITCGAIHLDEKLIDLINRIAGGG